MIARRLAIPAVLVAALGAGLWGLYRWQRNVEAEHLLQLAEIRTGSVVAEIGAGDGWLTVKAASLVRPSGRVFATEVEEHKRRAIADAARAASLSNVETRQAKADAANLPESCCDAILIRHVYHHIPQPEPFLRSLYESARPGALIVIADFPPGGLMGWLPAVKDAPKDRGGHGIAPDMLASELTAAGFEITNRIDDWYLRDFCIVARRPEIEKPPGVG